MVLPEEQQRANYYIAPQAMRVSKRSLEMIEGLYKVQIQTPLGMGFGVIHLQNGTANGGDSAIAYVGNYSVDEGRFSSTIQVSRHSDGLPSVLGVDSATLNVEGNVDGNTVVGDGTAPQAPGVNLSVQLSLLKAA